jgi:hypothetical protein
MKNLPRAIGLLLFAAAVLLTFSTSTIGQGVQVYGVVTNSAGRPVPGVAVSLIHPVNGRSRPSYTDQFGRYAIAGVPPHPAPYFVEIYWGQQLIYRQQVIVNGPMQWNATVR